MTDDDDADDGDILLSLLLMRKLAASFTLLPYHCIAERAAVIQAVSCGSNSSVNSSANRSNSKQQKHNS